MDWLIRLGGWWLGLTGAQVTTVERALPRTRELLDLVGQAQPLIRQQLALVNKATPLIDAASLELQAIIPALDIVLDTIARHVAAGSSNDQAVLAIKNTLAKLEPEGTKT